ncbi:hypothetical protein ACIHQR_17285 [Corallococcus coralloides]|uniref:hypothetical protein n=1 Tax=Corallococcus TaxID=83461 RepID=UPI001CBB86F7|nr:hypothetical protein [Corallococcus sp. AS-1-12]MBZ4329357.1 hypothetical protein [Corallococcus sp. AS-1-12]
MFKVTPSHVFRDPSRHQIDQSTHGKTSDYSHAVGGVNQLLDKNGIGISERSKSSVIDNVNKVETGARSEVNAHQREALNFGRDAFESIRKGQFKQGAVEAFGSGLNAAASVYKSLSTPTPAEQRGIDP